MKKNTSQIVLMVILLISTNESLKTNNQHNSLFEPIEQNFKLKLLYSAKISSSPSMQTLVPYPFDSDLTLLLKLLYCVNFKDCFHEQYLNRTVRNTLRLISSDIHNQINPPTKSSYLEQSYFFTLVIQQLYQTYNLKKN